MYFAPDKCSPFSRCHDVCGRDADVQFPDFEARGQEEVPVWGPQQWPPGDKNEQKISSLPSSLPIYLPQVNNNQQQQLATSKHQQTKH